MSNTIMSCNTCVKEAKKSLLKSLLGLIIFACIYAAQN